MAKANEKPKPETTEVKGVEVVLKVIPYSKLNIHEKNARKGNHKLIKKSIQKHGFIDPIVVQKSTMNILGGNNRVVVAEKLGINKFPAQVIDVDDHEAVEIMLILNKAADEASYDEEKLYDAITTVVGESEDIKGALDGTGYAPSDYEALQLRRDWQDKEEVKKAKKGKSRKEEAVTETERRESLDERKKKIEELGMRQIVLSVPVKVFKEFQAALKEARSEMQVKYNEELMVMFLQNDGYLGKDFTLIEEKEKPKAKKGKT